MISVELDSLLMQMYRESFFFSTPDRAVKLDRSDEKVSSSSLCEECIKYRLSAEYTRFIAMV